MLSSTVEQTFNVYVFICVLKQHINTLVLFLLLLSFFSLDDIQTCLDCSLSLPLSVNSLPCDLWYFAWAFNSIQDFTLNILFWPYINENKMKKKQKSSIYIDRIYLTEVGHFMFHLCVYELTKFDFIYFLFRFHWPIEYVIWKQKVNTTTMYWHLHEICFLFENLERAHILR